MVRATGGVPVFIVYHGSIKPFHGPGVVLGPCRRSGRFQIRLANGESLYNVRAQSFTSIPLPG